MNVPRLAMVPNINRVTTEIAASRPPLEKGA
jgi:hypothetical protein